MEMKDKNKAKAIADERMRLIAPLLSPALDCAQIKQMKEELSKANGISQGRGWESFRGACESGLPNLL